MKMTNDRTKDPEYPRTYESWTSDRGQLMVIQDLRPEDDDVVLELLEKNMITDETLCRIQKLCEDPESLRGMLDFWADCLKDRMSLGCYEVKDGKKYVVAVNVLLVVKKGEHHHNNYKGEKWENVYAALVYAENKSDAYEHLGLDRILYAMGLCVRREYRGMSLGQKLLAAREPLCKTQGIRGTATVFSGIASQIPAEKCGFTAIADFPIKELAAAGLPYPDDDERRIKYMIKKYNY